MRRQGSITAWVNNPAFDTDPENLPEEIELSADYSFYPGCAATREQPAEGPEIEITNIRDKATGAEYSANPEQIEALTEKASDDVESADLDMADYLYDRDRDDRLMGVGRYAPHDGRDDI